MAVVTRFRNDKTGSNGAISQGTASKIHGMKAVHSKSEKRKEVDVTSLPGTITDIASAYHRIHAKGSGGGQNNRLSSLNRYCLQT